VISLTRTSLESSAVAEILLYFYVPIFLWKDFSMGQIKKIQKIKKERMEERKRRDFFGFFIKKKFNRT
jgi:hypothetical protein